VGRVTPLNVPRVYCTGAAAGAAGSGETGIRLRMNCWLAPVPRPFRFKGLALVMVSLSVPGAGDPPAPPLNNAGSAWCSNRYWPPGCQVIVDAGPTVRVPMLGPGPMDPPALSVMGRLAVP